MELLEYLHLMVRKGASDLFFSVGAPVNIKIEGVTHPLNVPALQPADIRKLAHAAMSTKQAADFEAHKEMNLAMSIGDTGRFRVNIFLQRGDIGMVVRCIKDKIPAVAELGLPQVLENLVMLNRGLVLLVGATSCGKSTTLAAMINYRNLHATGHILCVEDPIEFLHQHKRSIVDQREVGLDTASYAEGLMNALREAPDVIMIGEIRDRATMQAAITYAETGHLCLSTLHASNANQALERAATFFPEDTRDQVYSDLSINLAAVIAQRLIPGTHNRLVPAVEVLLNSPYVAELISKGDIGGIKDAMSRGHEVGMRTFDHALYELYVAGQISLEEALRNADSRTDLSLRIRLTDGTLFNPESGLSLESPSGSHSPSAQK